MTKQEFHKKLENYWYYYKIHTIVAVLVIIVLAFLITQCAKKVDPDMTVMLVSKRVSISEDQQTKLEKVLSDYTEDVNNDGKKIVTVEVLNIDDENGDAQYSSAMRQKLMVEVAGTNNTIFVTDDEFYNYLNKDKDFFCDISTISDKVAIGTDRITMKDIKAFDIDDLQKYYGDLTIGARLFSGKSPLLNDKNEIKNQATVLKKLLETYTPSSNK